LRKKAKNIEFPVPEKKTESADSLLKKQFRFSDWFAEKVIKAIAFLSITIVILIFVFVFRETLPLFQKQKQVAAVTGNTNTAPGADLQPESYSAGEPDTSVLKPETYSAGEPETSALTPETYSAGEPETNALKPESYGSVPDSALSASQSPAVTENMPSYIGEYTESENRKAIGTFTSKDWQPVSDNPRYGLIPLFFGTLKVTIIAILFAAPISILAALYTAMFAPKKIREYIKPAVELLAGFPSVVIGFFALMILASFLQDLFGYSGRLNAFVGGIAMALAAIPVIYTLTEDALSAVPKTYMEASLGLGASLRQTAFGVILPAATPGIFAAVLLGIGRVFGETMIALMATGNAALITLNPFDSVRTLSATIGAEMAEVVFGDTHYSVLFLIGSLLFIFTFILNALAEFYFRNRLIRRFQGKKS
jgi:phosphate transport system permease protein